MNDRPICFGKFEFPRVCGLEYQQNEAKSDTDYLFVGDRNDSFSMYFEKDFPIFSVPDKPDWDYCLFELKRKGRVIRFFCPEKRKDLDSAVWYFYVDLLDEQGAVHSLPGQVRVGFETSLFRPTRSKPKFIEVLESVRLKTPAAL